MTELETRLQQCFAVVFPEMSEREMPAASMASVASWDSLTAVTLNAVIEEEFDIQIPASDLDDFVSFELILDYLRRSTAHGDPGR